jgi:L-seryl-tRNA(Ser) seleniumtransferase
MADARRSIPSVDRLLSSDAFVALQQKWSRSIVVGALQAELAILRSQAGGAATDAHVDATLIAERVRGSIENLAGDSLVPVINATGVVLHTNLGRAPLADTAIEAMATVARGYSNLEYDAVTGSRGSRYVHCRALLCQLTGAEDALVVNNNAAALVLALNTLAYRREVIVSRGELVEIGGAFRVPEIMARSGAKLHEVGSTNRTHIHDYRDAISKRTGALLKVQPSNFTIAGYTADVSVRELAATAADAGLPLIHDVGSGLLIDPVQIGLPAEEPMARNSIADGADIVTMSGDKLLGGPQAGIILGPTVMLDRMRRNPLCRALRVDKLTLAGLASTLRLYLEPARALCEIPVLRMLTLDARAIESRAEALAHACAAFGLDARVVAGTSAVGGGAAADTVLPTALVLVRGVISANELDRRLRAGSPSIVTRIVDGCTAIDLRTVSPEDDAVLPVALGQANRS